MRARARTAWRDAPPAAHERRRRRWRARARAGGRVAQVPARLAHRLGEQLGQRSQQAAAAAAWRLPQHKGEPPIGHLCRRQPAQASGLLLAGASSQTQQQERGSRSVTAQSHLRSGCAPPASRQRASAATHRGDAECAKVLHTPNGEPRHRVDSSLLAGSAGESRTPSTCRKAECVHSALVWAFSCLRVATCWGAGFVPAHCVATLPGVSSARL